MFKKRYNSPVDANGAAIPSVLAKQNEQALIDDDATSDERLLGDLGYKQEFKRDFTIWESFSLSFSVLGILPSVASTISFAFGYAGTAGALWGWLIAGIFIQFVAISMAELCSAMPTAGGLYYAAAVLAPDGWGPLASWFVGYSNMIGFGIGPASINYALAAQLVTAGQIAHPAYVPQNWHIYLTVLGLMGTQAILAMQSTKFVGWLNKIGTILNIIALLVFIIWFPAGSINHPKTNPNSVWTQFENGTDFPIGYATIMGFLTAIYTICGFDAPFHVSEECSNANVAGPRAIVMTAQFGLYLGWAVVMVIAYTIKDLGSVLNSAYGQPFASLCLQVLGPKSGLAMLSLNIVTQYFVGLGVLITASRIIFSIARDGALPASRLLAHVDRRFRTPVNAVWFVAFYASLISLLLFAGPIAINAIFTVAAIGQYTSFTAPVALKLFTPSNKFRPGPWNLGRWSKPVGVVVVCWWLVILPALCFPAYRGSNLTAQNMNWTCLVYGGSMFLAMSFYAVYGRKFFKGPKINIEHVANTSNSFRDQTHNEKEPSIIQSTRSQPS